MQAFSWLSLFLNPQVGGNLWSCGPRTNPCSWTLRTQRQQVISFGIFVYNEELLSFPGPVTSFWPCGKQLLSPQARYPSAGLILQCGCACLYQSLSLEMLCFGFCCLMFLHRGNAQARLLTRRVLHLPALSQQLFPSAPCAASSAFPPR